MGFVWEWFNDNGFVAFGKPEQKKLEKAYKKNKKGTLNLTIMGKTYTCSFSDMQQTNQSTQFKRQIRRVKSKKSKSDSESESKSESESEESKSSSSSSSDSDSDSDKKEKKKKEKKEGGEDKKEKKEKPKKVKLAYCTPQTYSKRFEYLYENKKYSDLTIKFEETGESLPAHQIVFASSSEVFETLIKEGKIKENNNEYLVPKSENVFLFKALIKFFYTGAVDYSDESALVSFMLLSNKYKIKNIKEFKIPGKTLLNGVIAYVEKDLTNRVSEFDSLVQSIDFKKFDKEDLTKIYSKKKWLQKSSTFLNIIISKESGSEGSSDSESKSSGSDSESGSSSGSSSDSSETSESEESEDDDDGVPKFQPKLSSSTLKFSKGNKVVVYNGNSNWQGTALASKATKWGIKLLNNCNDLMIGMATKKINKNGNNYNSSGFYFYTSNGYKYAEGNLCQNFTSGGSSNGTNYSFNYNKKKGELTIYRDGSSLGLLYSNLSGELFPAFDFYTGGCSIELTKFKGKK